jgi:hypothetical protein
LNGCRSITPDLFKHFKCMGVCLCKTFHCFMIVNLVHLVPRPLRVVRIKISPSLLSLQKFVTDFTRQRLANGDRSANRLTLLDMLIYRKLAEVVGSTPTQSISSCVGNTVLNRAYFEQLSDKFSSNASAGNSLYLR